MKAPSTKDSYIIRLATFLSRLFYTVLPFGLIGRIFTSYSATDRAFRSSGLSRIARRSRRSAGRARRSLRRNVALAVNHSLFVRGAAGFWTLLCCCSLRTIGAFFVTMGSYSALSYWLFTVVWGSSVVGSINLYWGAGFLLLGILLLFSNVSLGYALTKSFFFGRLIVSALGISDGGIRTVEREGKRGYVIAVPLGMALGAVGALTSPVWLIVGFVALLLALMILSVPEAGVVLLIFVAPFIGLLPSSKLWLMLLIALPFVGYLGKLLRGNRAFHLEVQDLPVLLLILLFFFSGLSFSGGTAWQGALYAALLISAYFLVVNLIATPAWMQRCRAALILSAAGSSLLGIVQFVQHAVGSWASFDFIRAGDAVRAGMVDRTTFAYFLVIAFCFTLTTFVTQKGREALVTGLALVLISVAVAVSFVPWAVIALVVSAVVFFLLYFRHSLPFAVMGVGLSGLLNFLMPAGIRNALVAYLQTDVTAAAPYRAGLEGFTARVFFENGEGFFSRTSGIIRLLTGLGYDGIESFCVLYTSVPAEAVSASLNFWSYRLLENGIFGVIVPAAFLFLLAQNCFSLLRRGENGRVQPFVLNGIALIAGILVLSAYSYTWYDPAALLLFFVAAAVIAAAARSERESRVTMPDKIDEYGRVIEIEYYGSAR